MDYQKQLMELLNQCQSTWVQLQSKDDSTNITYRKELRVAIKQLVQLQDDYDELESQDSKLAWEERAQQLLDQIYDRLEPILKVEQDNKQRQTEFTSDNNDLVSKSTTLKDYHHGKELSSVMNREDDKMEQKQVANKQQRPPEISIFNSPFSQSRFTARPSPSSSTPWTSTIHQESTIREFQALSIGEAPSPPEDPLSSSNEYGAARLSKSNSSLSMYSLPSNVIDAPSPHQTRMELTRQKQPQTVEEIPEIRNERRSKLNIPLFKNISSSYSSPVPGALAQINFYKNDNDTDDNKIFASDAVVSHPLRIGVGYGSYICYSCTVFSNKGAPITIRKRYSDFVDIRQQLIKRYPNMKSIPKLPPKKLVKKFDPTFIEQRRRDLEYFFKYIVLHPNLGSSSIVKQWIAP